MVVEAIGTWALALMITASAVVLALRSPGPNALVAAVAVAVVGGATLSALVTGLGPVSGAHLNPAVTIAVALSGAFSWRRAPAYVTAQLAGATAAAASVWWLYGSEARTVGHLGAPMPAADVGTAQAAGAELMATFLLVLVILTSTRSPRSVTPLGIGAALAAGIAFSGPISGGGLNPAVAIAPMIVAKDLQYWWLYLVAPVAGAMLAAGLWHAAEPDDRLSP